MADAHLRILLIEDDEEDWILTRTVLEEIPGGRYTMDWVSSAAAAYASLAAQPYDLCLLDYRLGMHNGLEVLARIREQYPAIPVIVLTGQDSRRTDLQAMEGGAADYLVKDQLDAAMLERAIRYARQQGNIMTALHASEERYRLISELTSDFAYTLRPEPDGTFAFEWMTPAFAHTMGMQPGEMDWHMLIIPDDLPVAVAHWHILRTRDAHVAEFRVRTAGGNLRWLRDYSSPVRDSDGNVTHIHGAAQDITERKYAEEALRESEERHRQMFMGNGAIKLLVSPETGAIVDANPAACAFYGYTWEQLTNFTIEKLGATLFDAYPPMRTGEQSPHETQHHLASGEVRDVEIHASVIDARGVRLVYSIIHDVTDRKQAEQILTFSALHDALTLLPNRALFMDRLSVALERAKRNPDYRYAVLYLDFDRFKLINDGFGHTAGDEFLVTVARRLEGCVRGVDTVARLGGDEFALLLDGPHSPRDAAQVAQRIHTTVAAPIDLHGHVVFVTTSIGIALSDTGYEHTEDVLRDADTAMYRAKARGRGETEVFDGEMHQRVLTQVHLESDLRRAIESEELRVYFQPITDLLTGRLVGFEALVRWQHPERGLVSPADFIPIAEDTGLIVPLDRWVLRHSCQTLIEWRTRITLPAPISLSVNLSGKHFNQPDLVEAIAAILQETGYEPQWLNVEITESSLIEHTESAMTKLAGLRALGVNVQVDDFGTGHSSLIYLHRFPITTLKLDRAFSSNADAASDIITRAIVTLAHDLKIDVVAEGLETEAQVLRVREFGCDYGQGYIFSPPMAIDALDWIFLREGGSTVAAM